MKHISELVAEVIRQVAARMAEKNHSSETSKSSEEKNER